MKNSNWSISIFGDTYFSESSTIFLDSSIKHFIDRSYIRGINFEGSFFKKSILPDHTVGIILKQDKKIFDFIRTNKINLVNLANNHLYDYGEKGLVSVLKKLKNATTVGAGSNFIDAYKLKIIHKGKTRIGFLSFCENQFGTLFDKSLKRGGVAWVNHQDVNLLIKNSKNKVDYLVIQVHAGVEDIDIPIPEWRTRYKELIDYGADVVIGHRPHVSQGWELYNNKPIFYSLGNFIFDSEPKYSNKIVGYAVELQFIESRFNKFNIHVLRRNKSNIYIDSSTNAEKYVRLLCTLLDKKSYNSYLEKIILHLWGTRYRNYYDDASFALTKKNIIRRFVNGLIRIFLNQRMQNDMLLLHNIRIESHLWVALRALNLRNKNP